MQGHVSQPTFSQREVETLQDQLDQFTRHILPLVDEGVVSIEAFRNIQIAAAILSEIDVPKAEIEQLEPIREPIRPQSESGGQRGRPKFEIKKEQLQFLVETGFTMVDIAKIIGVGTRTIERRFKSFGLSSRTRNYTKMAEDDLEGQVINIKRDFPKIGYRQVMGILRSRGIWVPRETVREIIRRCDPVGVSLRWFATVERRVYNVFAPGSLWHIDGNHKLIR